MVSAEYESTNPLHLYYTYSSPKSYRHYNSSSTRTTISDGTAIGDDNHATSFTTIRDGICSPIATPSATISDGTLTCLITPTTFSCAPTATLSPTFSTSGTPTATLSHTFSGTHTATLSPTFSGTPTAKLSPTFSGTPTATLSPTFSGIPTATLSTTISNTAKSPIAMSSVLIDSGSSASNQVQNVPLQCKNYTE